ncbi:NBS-LRR type resistance protein [Cucumis melo var. makuwa]|uniref:NBS-LRR type resistance protein n=2 Tax=Cucumis melo var. makuwa TaxID=1194695 RepID=A0A5A7UGS2_CUCMM|nr:NBS-LRR type resistance protein [Cucumis melo var. makuwa]
MAFTHPSCPSSVCPSLGTLHKQSSGSVERTHQSRDLRGCTYQSSDPEGYTYQSGDPEGYTYQSSDPEGYTYPSSDPEGCTYQSSDPEGYTYQRDVDGGSEQLPCVFWAASGTRDEERETVGGGRDEEGGRGVSCEQSDHRFGDSVGGWPSSDGEQRRSDGEELPSW